MHIKDKRFGGLQMRIIKYLRSKGCYQMEHVRIVKTKRYTYKYYFTWHHDENPEYEHTKNGKIPEYIINRNGRRAVFYEDVSRREKIQNDDEVN